MSYILIPVIILVLFVLYAVFVYNSLNALRVRVKAAVQEIGNQLKRQADLIPNLVESTKGYMRHEKEIFTALSDARKQISSALKTGNVKEMVTASSTLSEILPRIQATFESNPEIKASSVVADLMDNLRDTSDKVSYARRLFIDLTADYNTKLVVFPSNLIAKMFGFKAEKGLEVAKEGVPTKVSSEETKTPKVEL